MHSLCPTAVCFLAKAHSTGIASFCSNILSQSLVLMIQLREMAFSSSLPSNLCHLCLQTRSLTLGNYLLIIFWHLKYIRVNGFYNLKFTEFQTLNCLGFLAQNKMTVFQDLKKFFFILFNKIEQKNSFVWLFLRPGIEAGFSQGWRWWGGE